MLDIFIVIGIAIFTFVIVLYVFYLYVVFKSPFLQHSFKDFIDSIYYLIKKTLKGL